MRSNRQLRKAGVTTALLLGTVSIASMTLPIAHATDAATHRSRTWLGTVDASVEAASARKEAKRASSPSRLGSSGDASQLASWWSVGGPAYRWNEIILEEMQSAFVVLPMAARYLALFHAALDDAVVITRQQTASGGASEHAAAAEAAAMVLGHLFPARAEHFTRKAEEAIGARASVKGETPERIAAGRAYGRKVAAVAIERAKSDGSDAKWSGTVPEGSGRWKGTNPIAPLAGTWRPWVLTSPSEFRPAAPPAVDSEQVKTALAELKSFARTPRTNHRATFWEVNGGARAHTLWNEIARAKLLETGTAERDGARILAALNIAIADAGVACWDAKYTFWFIRPSQLDAELKPLFAPPNHPSFPAAHGCFSTAAATVLAHSFPSDREKLLSLGREAAEARVWAGIHFRFDIEAGQEIGRKVGEAVLARAFPQ